MCLRVGFEQMRASHTRHVVAIDVGMRSMVFVIEGKTQDRYDASAQFAFRDIHVAFQLNILIDVTLNAP